MALVAFWTVEASGARAQPAPEGETAWAVPEVVVRPSAPRVWKLTRGASSVYVYGSIGPLPKGQAWNSGQAARILMGANRLIDPPTAAMNLSGAVLAATRLPQGQTLDGELSEAQRARLHALLTRLGRKPQDLDGDKAAWAAFDLLRALRGAGGLSDDEPLATLHRLARDKHVPIKATAQYDALPALKELLGLPEERGIALLDQATQAGDWALDHASAIGQAWAAGDLKALREAEGPSASLVDFLRNAAAAQILTARARDDIVATVNAALAQPGVSVAVINLDHLARRGEALDILRGQEVQVTEPEG